MTKKKIILSSLVLSGIVASFLGAGVAYSLHQKGVDDISFKINAKKIRTTLDTPVLSSSGSRVSWTAVEDATSYTYYVNGGENQTTTNTYVDLDDGDTVVVSAVSSNDDYLPSDWSIPKTIYDVEGTPSYVNVAFAFIDKASKQTIKGRPFSDLPTPGTKTGYTFGGWYTDPFFADEFVSGTALYENTVLYAKWIPEEYMDTTFFLKADARIDAPNADVHTDWKLIPLKFHSNHVDSGKTYIWYYADIEVAEGTTSDNRAYYLVTNTSVHSDHSQYWKRNSSTNFSIKSPGFYRIYFSAAFSWDDGGNAVHAYCEQLLSNPFPVSKSALYRTASERISIPDLSLDKTTDTVSWEPVEGASRYEYQIDNGDVVSTTSNNARLYQGSFITVRAISDDSSLNSKWSSPTVYPYKEYPTSNFSYVYYYDCGRNSFKVTNGNSIAAEASPTKAGFTFNGWYQELACTHAVSFPLTITKNTVLYPKWTRNDSYVFYDLIDELGNDLGELKYHSSEKKFNQYRCQDFTTTHANSTIKVVDPNDHTKVYETKLLETESTYTVYFSMENIWNMGTADAKHVWTEVSYYYFTRPTYNGWNNNDAAPNVYGWKGSNNNGWPGVGMSYVKDGISGEKIFRIRLYHLKDYEWIIFNGNGQQTVDISIVGVPSGQQWYCNGADDRTGSNYNVTRIKYNG